MRTAWFLLVAAGCKPDPAGTEVLDRSASGPSALVIIVDGVRTDEFSSTEPSDLTGLSGETTAADTWAALAPIGTVDRVIRNTGITVTAPAHAAMLVGRPEPYANFTMRGDDGPSLYRPTLPTIFEEARDQLGLQEDDLHFITNTTLLEGLNYGVYPGAGQGARGEVVHDPVNDDGWPADDATVLDAVRDAIDAGPPRLIVVNLHDVDRAGHYGEDGEYVDRVYDVDPELARFRDWLDRTHANYAKQLLMVVTADHGRHRPGVDEAYRNHGDTCDGCREVPLFLVGGGAHAGAEIEGDYTSLDLVPTIAAHMGITLPWAQGLPMVEAFDDLTGVDRSGEIGVSTSGDLVATQAWLDDRSTRSEVQVDGVPVSTVGALGAEAPAVWDGEIGRFVCWRELTDDGDSIPWVQRCLADTDGTGWTDIGFPTRVVGPYGRPAFAERDGRLWVAWADNPHGTADLRDDTVGLSVASWSPEGGWSADAVVVGYFPTDAAIAATTSGVVGAYGTNLDDPDSRYTRRVRVAPLTESGGVAHPSVYVDFTLTSLLGSETRVEHPALTATGDTVKVAMIGIGTAETIVAAAASTDGGNTFTDPVALPDGGDPLPHLSPAWDGDRVVWGALVDGEAMLCRAAPGDADADCRDLGSPRLDSFTVANGVATAVIDTGTAQWARTTVTW